VQEADWLGVNCHWTESGGALSLQGAGLLEEHRGLFPDKLLMVTEFGNASSGVDPAEKARQYVDFHAAASRLPNVGAAFGYVLLTTTRPPGARRETSHRSWADRRAAPSRVSVIPGMSVRHRDAMTIGVAAQFSCRGCGQPPPSSAISGYGERLRSCQTAPVTKAAHSEFGAMTVEHSRVWRFKTPASGTAPSRCEDPGQAGLAMI
jgi:hypothetical protein